jgi:hypothetical protein
MARWCSTLSVSSSRVLEAKSVSCFWLQSIASCCSSSRLCLMYSTITWWAATTTQLCPTHATERPPSPLHAKPSAAAQLPGKGAPGAVPCMSHPQPNLVHCLLVFYAPTQPLRLGLQIRKPVSLQPRRALAVRGGAPLRVPKAPLRLVPLPIQRRFQLFLEAPFCHSLCSAAPPLGLLAHAKQHTGSACVESWSYAEGSGFRVLSTMPHRAGPPALPRQKHAATSVQYNVMARCQVKRMQQRARTGIGCSEGRWPGTGDDVAVNHNVCTTDRRSIAAAMLTTSASRRWSSSSFRCCLACRDACKVARHSSSHFCIATSVRPMPSCRTATSCSYILHAITGRCQTDGDVASSVSLLSRLIQAPDDKTVTLEALLMKNELSRTGLVKATCKCCAIIPVTFWSRVVVSFTAAWAGDNALSRPFLSGLVINKNCSQRDERTGLWAMEESSMPLPALAKSSTWLSSSLVLFGSQCRESCSALSWLYFPSKCRCSLSNSAPTLARHEPAWSDLVDPGHCHRGYRATVHTQKYIIGLLHRSFV